MNKRLIMINFENNSLPYLTKDMCTYPYYLGKNHGWECSYAYFSNGGAIHLEEFEKHCSLIYLGKHLDYKTNKKVAKEFIKNNIYNYDWLCFFNYGGATYRLALYAKSINPKIKVYNKMDMSDSGFAHFYDGTFWRKLHIIPEYFKSRGIDLFTVENTKFYNQFLKMKLFKKRIRYLPNTVSKLGVDINKIMKETEKENIIITIGRLGTEEKNNELLVRALICIGEAGIRDWRVLFVGRDDGNFGKYLDEARIKNPWLKNIVILTGEVTNREELYKMCARARIICMTSRCESYGIATIEGMMFGAYPIVTNYGSIVNDITKNGEYGTITEHSEASVANAIKDLISRDDINAINDKIMKYARENFNCELWSAKLNEYLLDIMGNNTTKP